MSRSRIIDINWSNRKLEKACTTDKAGQRKWGAKQWPVLRRRLMALRGAPSLAAMSGLPGGCHALTADRRGQFAVDLWGPFRLIFAPDHESIPTLDDGALDLVRITRIKVLEVVDYHGR